jgi:hypothetical protein
MMTPKELQKNRKLPAMMRMTVSSTPAAIAVPVAQLIPGPGVRLHHAIPEVQMRPLSIYEEVAHVAAV